MVRSERVINSNLSPWFSHFEHLPRFRTPGSSSSFLAVPISLKPSNEHQSLPANSGCNIHRVSSSERHLTQRTQCSKRYSTNDMQRTICKERYAKNPFQQTPCNPIQRKRFQWNRITELPSSELFEVQTFLTVDRHNSSFQTIHTAREFLSFQNHTVIDGFRSPRIIPNVTPDDLCSSGAHDHDSRELIRCKVVQSCYNLLQLVSPRNFWNLNCWNCLIGWSFCYQK